MILRLLLLCSLVLVGCEDSDSGVVIFLPSGDAETPSSAADSTIEVDLRMSGAFDAGVEIIHWIAHDSLLN